MVNQATLPYDSQDVANQLIGIADQNDESMSILRLLKLAYMSHGWNLAITDEPLVNDFVQAWKYGPVIPSIYYSFRFQPPGPYNLKKIRTVKEQIVDKRTNGLMEEVYALYRNLSDSQLLNLTHIRGGPWHLMYNPGERGVIIPNELISNHFKDKHERSRTNSP